MSRSRSPWSRRCPKGHSSIKTRAKVKDLSDIDRYECIACKAFYAGPPTDIRDVEGYPLDESEYEVISAYGTYSVASDSSEGSE